MSDVRRRIDSGTSEAAAAGSEPASQYDGTDAPVLIRLPDLAARADGSSSSPIGAATSSASTETSTETGTGRERPAADRRNRSPARGRTGKRRIDRSHLPQRPKIPVPENARFDLRSKSFVAILLIAVVGLSYIFMKGGNEPDSGGWVASPVDEGASGVDLGSDYPDLWADDGKPRDTAKISSSAAVSDSEPTLGGTPDPTLAPSDNRTLSGPGQWENQEATTWPVGSTTTDQAEWPDSPSQPTEATQVSWPDFEDGATNTRPTTRDLAAMVGLQRRASANSQLVAFNPSQTPFQRRNHERLRTSLD